MDVTGPGQFHITGVEVADTPRRRLRGLMGREPVPLLIRGASVHGFWVRGSLWAVGLAADLTVTAVKPLRRRGVVWLPGCRWILELPSLSPLPRQGDRLAFHRAEGEAGAYGGTPLPLFDTDRQPG